MGRLSHRLLDMLRYLMLWQGSRCQDHGQAAPQTVREAQQGRQEQGGQLT
jgi:hypothetical protein